MARKKKESVMSGDYNDWRSKVHFVDFSIDDEIAIKEWYDAVSPVWTTCLEQLVDDQWAVKISPPKGGDDWFLTGQFRGQGQAYDGHSFTVRYPDMATGVILLFWVITSMLEDGQMSQVLDSKSRAWLG